MTEHTKQRPFGFWTATALVVGGMIGAGIFVQPAQLAPFGWTGAVAWLIAIPAAMLLAYVLSRLTAAQPGATGIVEIVGGALGPLPGLLVGWSYWVIAKLILILLHLTCGNDLFRKNIATAFSRARSSATTELSDIKFIEISTSRV